MGQNIGESLLVENCPEIGPAMGESMGQNKGENVLAENGPEIGPSYGIIYGTNYRRKSAC
jgi:hypothetical protein